MITINITMNHIHKYALFLKFNVNYELARAAVYKLSEIL